MNKGEDLNGVIIEVGDFSNYEEISKYGVLWSPHEYFEDHEIQFAALLKVGDHSLFKNFVNHYTSTKIIIETIKENQIDFTFESNSLSLEISEFFTGLFGPGRFEELSNLSPLYISGLDSI
jgi:hypothetical protein